MGIFKRLQSEYGGFEQIENLIGSSILHKYTESIYQQYCKKYTDATYMISVESRLKHYHASKKMILSALFYTQARYLVDHNAKNLSFYSMYYSLFSALLSNILVLPIGLWTRLKLK